MKALEFVCPSCSNDYRNLSKENGYEPSIQDLQKLKIYPSLTNARNLKLRCPCGFQGSVFQLRAITFEGSVDEFLRKKGWFS